MHLITTTLSADPRTAEADMSSPTAAWADQNPGRGGQGGVVITKTTSISTTASTTDTSISAAGAGAAGGDPAAGMTTTGRGTGAAGNAASNSDVITSTQTSTQIVTLRPSVTNTGTGLVSVSAATVASSSFPLSPTTSSPTLSSSTPKSTISSTDTTAMSASPTTHEPVPSPSTPPASIQQSATKKPFLQTPGGIVTIVFVVFIILALAILAAWFYRRKRQRADRAAFRELDGEEAAMRRDQGDWSGPGGGVPLRPARSEERADLRQEGSSGSDGEKMGPQPGTPFTSPFGSMRRPRPVGEKREDGELGISGTGNRTAAHPGNMLPEERVEEYRRKAAASPVSEKADGIQPERQQTSPQTIRDDAIMARQQIKTRIEAEREKRMKDGVRDYPSPSSSPKPADDAAAMTRKQSRRERRADMAEKRTLGRQANPDLTTSGFLTSLEEEKRISAERKERAVREREKDAMRSDPLDSPAQEQKYDISGHPIRAPSPPRQLSKKTGKPLALTRDQVVLPAIWAKMRGQPIQQQHPEEEHGSWTVVNWEDMTPSERAQETERVRLEDFLAAQKAEYEARPPGGGHSQAVIDDWDYKKNIATFPHPSIKAKRRDEFEPLVGFEECYEGAGPDAYMARELSTQLVGQDYDPNLPRGSPVVPEKHPDRMVGYGGEEMNEKYLSEPDRMVVFSDHVVPPPGPAWRGPPEDEDAEDVGVSPSDELDELLDQRWDVLLRGPRRGPPRYASPVESRPKGRVAPPIPSNEILQATRDLMPWEGGWPGVKGTLEEFLKRAEIERKGGEGVKKGGEGVEGDRT